MTLQSVSPEKFPFASATQTRISVAYNPEIVYLVGPESYTRVDVEKLPEYLPQLSEEGRRSLRSELRCNMDILQSAAAAQNFSLGMKPEVMLDALALNAMGVHIANAQRHYQRLGELYQMLG